MCRGLISYLFIRLLLLSNAQYLQIRICITIYFTLTLFFLSTFAEILYNITLGTEYIALLEHIPSLVIFRLRAKNIFNFILRSERFIILLLLKSVKQAISHIYKISLMKITKIIF